MKNERTCLSCRGKAEKSSLLRFVFKDKIVFDTEQKIAGRGTYLHKDAKCLKSVKLKSFVRSFKVDQGLFIEEDFVKLFDKMLSYG